MVFTTRFSDTKNHWASLFIEALTAKRILNGYPDGTFRPNNSVNRAEFAAIVAAVFNVSIKRQYINFTDIPANFWAAGAIKEAYETGFLSGFPDKTFRPSNQISRGDVIVSLANGLEMSSKIKPDLLDRLPQIYEDAASIPAYGRNQIAIATSAGLVASFPNTKLLNFGNAATRADVAVIIYQALLYLGQVEKIPSAYIVVPSTSSANTVRVNHPREFRGAWITTVWNSDWPSKAGLSTTQQQNELVAILTRLQELNFNAIILQVRPEGDALYASELEPWSAWLTGTQGQAPEPLYDPLQFAIAEAHKRNIEVHAWFNPYRAKTSIKSGSNVRPHIAVTNPEVVYQWGNQLWMDPGRKIVQDRAYNVIMDVVRRYDIDAVHLDDYFYPYPIQGQSFPDNKTYAAYKAAGGQLSLNDWRRQNVDQMVLRLSQGIKATKPHVKFGISPFGIYRPGQPPGITGLDAYSVLYADSKKWLEQGWVDYLAPQLYWRTDQTQQSYPVLLKWWTEINSQRRHIYAGNNIGQLDGKAWKSEEIEKQVKISRNQATDLSLGNIFFSVGSIIENRQDISDTFQNSLYAKPALVPTMSWRSTTAPAPPKELQVNNRRLSWQPGDNQPVRSWTLYRQSDSNWTIQRVLSAGTTFATVQPGTYAVCAVDRLANESLGVVIRVS
ncbi:glycoside hydrolase family 10 protein [Anabaena azotica]|uniref:Family 10 glycosylhydrolase n=1 Tax=Anabaena azotica FACHB-119 TaxID=947527 RepID=A0ABR8DAH8_9NOST|nr:family 10 glycosylhydrolase [Anabaena azotica]MBD2504210.1 family 10 glycosylhydrolase [Anabaena azotica FACHB-119]